MCCFPTIRVKWSSFSFKNTNVSLLNAIHVEKLPSKVNINHKNARKVTLNPHKVDAFSIYFEIE